MAVALGVAGCQEPQRDTPGVIIREQTTSVEELAALLGLRIAERDETFVVLKNAANTVILFAHAEGRFFVNGKVIGSVGTVEKADNTVYVSKALVDEIRPHLRVPGVPELMAPRPRPRPVARTLVVIDAGHGGHDPGAIGPGGVREKDINLHVAARVANLLEQSGVGVVMTRWQDRFIELEDRAALANRRNADLFVSIHADSAPNHSAQGFTVYVATAASADSYKAARAISQAMTGAGSDSRGVREADYRVLVQTGCPAVLVELGYLSNAQDAARLRDPYFQNRLAQAIADGITACLR